MKCHAVILTIGVLAAAASGSVLAQSTDTKSDQPKAIGVSQETANKADAKAKANGDTATLVRTGPTAAERASDAASKAKNKTSEMTANTKAKVHDAAGPNDHTDSAGRAQTNDNTNNTTTKQ